MVEHSSTDPNLKLPGSIPGRSHTGVMDYDEACIMHLAPGVVSNFPRAVGVQEFCQLCTKRSQIRKEKGGKEKGATCGILVTAQQ